MKFRIGKRGSLDFPQIQFTQSYCWSIWDLPANYKKAAFHKTLYCHLLEILSFCGDLARTRQVPSKKM